MHSSRRCISAAASSMDSKQKRYVDALKHVILASPPSGSNIDEITSALATRLGGDADPTRFGFAKFSHALRNLQDDFYIINRHTLIRCDWTKTLRNVRTALPVEGVLLPAFLRHVAHACPGFDDQSIPGYTTEDWIAKRWEHLFSVTPNVSNRAHTIFRRVDVMKSESVQQIERALSFLGRSMELPVYTNAEDIIPLLPHRGNNQRWPLQLLSKGDIAEAFDMDVDVLLSLPEVPHFEVFIDGGTVSPIEVRRALGQLREASLEAALQRDEFQGEATVSASSSVSTSSEEHPLRITAFRYPHHAPHPLSTDVVVESFLNIEDEMVAAVAVSVARAASSPRRTAVLIVGDDVASRYVQLLGEALPTEVMKSIRLCTPIRSLALTSE